ncbi:MAG: radical SAM protein [Desulfomonile tiedjei]|uniref:Radical SAM protein n=1 Tax=Desulfomonile tiedjei TaxID=2358 RepID=A0A9D6Z4Z6_9BACT|nr:radical SAM protein [Desulfomonile tiedjei]
MRYIGAVYRPPSEAQSLIIQATLGCNHNKCTFCGSYRDKRFQIRSLEDIKEDLAEARHMGPVERVFLADGDALCIPQKRLEDVMRAVNEALPSVERIGIYANAKNILRKSLEDLKALRALKLGILYLGVETGDPDLLVKICKGATYEQLVEAARRVKDAGITLSVTVLLGIGGINGGEKHASGTARILTDMDPDYVGALSVIVVPGTPLHEEYVKGEFSVPEPFDLINELRIMIAESSFSNCVFRSNHASNYLPVKATLPRDKDQILEAIDRVLRSRDQRSLRPEFMRAL